MSRSATRNEATTRLQPPKRTTSAELPIGTAIRGSRERVRTVADGCDRERNVERTHPQPPDPQSETGTLATHSGKNCFLFLHVQSPMKQFLIWNVFSDKMRLPPHMQKINQTIRYISDGANNRIEITNTGHKTTCCIYRYINIHT